MNKKIINLGIVGFGTVGMGVVKILQHSPAMFTEKTSLRPIIRKIVDIDKKRCRDVRIPAGILSKNVQDVLDDSEINVVIELTGNESAARKILLDALSRKKNVITANKSALAKYWDEIFAAARKNGVEVYYESAVCAGLPIIQVLQQGLAANRISRIFGIVNGTTNYILTRMDRDDYSFKDALVEAQKKGFAESNPTLDINGYDSLHKIVILSSLAFGKRVKIEDVYVEGIDKIEVSDIKNGAELGYVLKLLAIAKEEVNKEIEVRVHPTFLPKGHVLSSVEEEYNAVYIVGDLTGPIVLYGRGAGQMSAASAVIGDLIYLGRRFVSGMSGRVDNIWEEKHSDLKIKGINEIRAEYYLRFSVVDSPGVLAKISNILGMNDISIAQVIQKSRFSGSVVPVVMMTHEAVEKNVQRALKLIDHLDIVKAKTVLIRVIGVRS